MTACTLHGADWNDDDEDEDDGGSDAEGSDAIRLVPVATGVRMRTSQERVGGWSVNLIRPELQRLRGLQNIIRKCQAKVYLHKCCFRICFLSCSVKIYFMFRVPKSPMMDI